MKLQFSQSPAITCAQLMSFKLLLAITKSVSTSVRGSVCHSFGQKRQLNLGTNITQLESSPVIGNSKAKAIICVFYTKLMVLDPVLQLI